MKCTDWSGIGARNRSANWFYGSVTIGVFALGFASAAAQSVTAPPPPPPEVTEQGPGATGEVLRTPSPFPFLWRGLGLRPHASYRLTYSEGARARGGQQSNTTINSFSPGMTFELGSRWIADYTPTWTYYSNEAFRDRVAHAASLKGGISFTDGNAQFVQTYALTTDSLVETGRQTRQEVADTSLIVSYALGQRSHLQAGISRGLRYVENAPNSREWTTNDSLHYQFSSRLDTAVALRYGYVDVDTGTDMHFVEPQLQLGWRPVNKLRFDGNVGRQHRTFSTSGLAPLNSSTYGVSAQYQPTETTALVFAANRGVSVSYFANQVNENSGWNATFSQRLLERFMLSGGYGRHHTRYIPTGAVILTGRDDQVSTFNLRLGTAFARRGNIAVFYQHTRNESNTSGFGFSSNQTGLEIGYRF